MHAEATGNCGQGEDSEITITWNSFRLSWHFQKVPLSFLSFYLLLCFSFSSINLSSVIHLLAFYSLLSAMHGILTPLSLLIIHQTKHLEVKPKVRLFNALYCTIIFITDYWHVSCQINKKNVFSDKYLFFDRTWIPQSYSFQRSAHSIFDSSGQIIHMYATKRD